jgi:hypothetical protein
MKTEEQIIKMAHEHWNWIEGLWDSLPEEAVFGPFV